MLTMAINIKVFFNLLLASLKAIEEFGSYGGILYISIP